MKAKPIQQWSKREAFAVECAQSDLAVLAEMDEHAYNVVTKFTKSYIEMLHSQQEV